MTQCLFYNKFFHVVAAQNAVGVDAGGQVVEGGGAVACHRKLAHEAALHVDDGEGGGLVEFIADVNGALCGVGEGGGGEVGHGLVDANGAHHYIHDDVDGDEAEGDVDIVGGVWVGDGIVDIDIDGKAFVNQAGSEVEGGAGEGSDAVAAGTDTPGRDAIFLDGSEGDDDVSNRTVADVFQLHSVDLVCSGLNVHGKVVTVLVGVAVVYEGNLPLHIGEEKAAEQQC